LYLMFINHYLVSPDDETGYLIINEVPAKR
jgi:hypothetical protein